MVKLQMPYVSSFRVVPWKDVGHHGWQRASKYTETLLLPKPLLHAIGLASAILVVFEVEMSEVKDVSFVTTSRNEAMVSNASAKFPKMPEQPHLN
jgi:hypothetical protein